MEEKEEKLLRLLDNTETGIRLRRVAALYEELQKKEGSFCDCFHVHCKKGCGKCCECFTPDITPAEADYLAFGLIAEGTEEQALSRLQNSSPENKGCPLYNKEDEAHHCTVYPFRPMICRLFGAAASEDKNGCPVFKNCKWNEKTAPLSSAEMQAHKENLVSMEEYGIRMEEENVDETETLLLPEALEKSINKLHLLLTLEEEK